MTAQYIIPLTLVFTLIMTTHCQRPSQDTEDVSAQPMSQAPTLSGTMRRGAGALLDDQPTSPDAVKPVPERPPAFRPILPTPEKQGDSLEEQSPAASPAPASPTEPIDAITGTDVKSPEKVIMADEPDRDPVKYVETTLNRLSQCTLHEDGLQITDESCLNHFRQACTIAYEEAKAIASIGKGVERVFRAALTDESATTRFYAVQGLRRAEQLSRRTKRALEQLIEGDDPVLAEEAAKARLNPSSPSRDTLKRVERILRGHRYRRVQLAACQYIDRAKPPTTSALREQLFALAIGEDNAPIVRGCAARTLGRFQRKRDLPRFRTLLGDPITAQAALMGLKDAPWTETPWQVAIDWFKENAENPDALHWSTMYAMLPPDGQDVGFPRDAAIQALTLIVAFRGHTSRTREIGIENLQRLKGTEQLKTLKQTLLEEDTEEGAALLRRIERALR